MRGRNDVEGRDMHRIVVVGGGVAGIVTATHLSRRLTRSNLADILLVDHNLAHVWKPMLHTFAAGTAHYADENISFISHAKRNHFRYWPGELSGLSRSRKTVEFGSVSMPDGEKLPGRSFSYDTLILAVGSRANDFGTSGVIENCHFIDDIGQALLFSDRLRSRVLMAIAARTDLHLVIVGGGATGVELAAELSHYMETLSRYATDEMPTHLRMTLVESGPRLLEPFPERISKSVEAKLRQLGIDVRTNTKVVGADAKGVILDGGSTDRGGAGGQGCRRQGAGGCLEARWSGSQPPGTDRGQAYVTEQGGRQGVRSRRLLKLFGRGRKASSNDCPSGSTTGRLPCTQSRRISQAKQAACRIPFPRHGEPRVAGRLRCLRHTRLLRLFPRRIPEGAPCSSCACSALSDAPDGSLWSRQGRCHLVRRRPVSRRPPAYPPRLIPALA